ncbi:MAG: NAD-dependent epimerase [Microcoleus sp. PH2017_29_MFU_D_A]|uniref:NAD-dependent epimerase n=1 Tax=unclassified Microcoleus TaxID=2642155 RepID=UPI001DE5CA26|nr:MULTISPECIES: NAD-dependent epimerase [unclassified Microcoleus]MCC3416964.1 NAD-dependent epimerase [Microcoleus sp. PH2017_07_MST_O_A]MCC3509738.1 NAD-dependent epimerase [Microcoleus sp. PH2017_17_BER_D_A]TAE69712.1 MAG: NAD-dependent epimerase [Oscillatoriales cyanobacterium]MCC3425929.1 NAD-dependent epimerase [Microcoleus sp. PH2017_01_SCD_O_A]MCC3435842.1 NAD-dependent epimerase [Microcoleus sp. PH2017_05_CCC_O_A]
MKILVTGAAGFIGYHLAQRLLSQGEQVYGIDNLNDYYDVNLKKARLAQLQPHSEFTFQQLDLSDRTLVSQLFQNQTFDRVVHLAAQAGVRYSLENPHAYADSNLMGFLNILEGCRHSKIKHLVFASSSSVYGNNTKIPFAVSDNVDHPISLYAATKKANELMAHSYSHLYNLPMTGLRFFTVYGAWGRPDMAYFKFVKAIAENKPIDVYNFGKMQRDFTYIDDVIEGVVRVMEKPPQSNSETSSTVPYKIYNIGNNSPVELLAFIEVVETAMGKKAVKNLLPMQPGDVPSTYADVDDLMADVGFKPSTPIEQGIHQFVEWYLDYYGGATPNSHTQSVTNIKYPPEGDRLATI